MSQLSCFLSNICFRKTMKCTFPTVANGDSLDWKDPTPQQICERVCSNVCPGSIVLFHNAAKNTPAALPSLIERLLSEGYSFVPISENIYYKDYEIDHTGRQWPVSASDVKQAE